MIPLSSAASTDKRSMPLGLSEQQTGDAVLSGPADMEVWMAGWSILLVLGCPIGVRMPNEADVRRWG